MFKKSLNTILPFIFLLSTLKVDAQAIPNPCDFEKVVCGESSVTKLFTSFDSDTIMYAPPGRSMPFWFAFGDPQTGIIDTLGSYNFSLSKVSGPGDIKGVPGTSNGYYAYLKDISFSEIGTYHVSINVSGHPGSFVGNLVFEVPPEANFCEESPNGDCVNGGGNQLFAKPQASNVIPVDAVLPIRVGVINSLTGSLDSSYSGTIYVDQISGPGELYGILSMTGVKWFDFNHLKFSAEGIYTIRFYEEDSNAYEEAFVEVEVIAGTNSTREVSFEKSMVFPNPIGDVMHIQIDSPHKNNVIEVFNTKGQLVLTHQITAGQKFCSINTTKLEQGVYFIKLPTPLNTLLKVIK